MEAIIGLYRVTRINVLLAWSSRTPVVMPLKYPALMKYCQRKQAVVLRCTARVAGCVCFLF